MGRNAHKCPTDYTFLKPPQPRPADPLPTRPRIHTGEHALQQLGTAMPDMRKRESEGATCP
jgi:hypothetical protein